MTVDRRGLIAAILVGVIGPADVDRWFQTRAQVGSTADRMAVPPRPDL